MAAPAEASPPVKAKAKVTGTWTANAGRPSWMVDGIAVGHYEGGASLEVVGESHHQAELRALVGVAAGRARVSQFALLVPETGNIYDESAVGVWMAGLQVGHLGRSDAADLRPGIIRLIEESGKAVALTALIVGGGVREDGREALLGVWLSYAPEDFGLPPQESRPGATSGFRTGLSEAIRTDEADDSYDLSWIDQLPLEPGRRLPRLRALMATEDDPISRHYLMRALESDLYTLRDLHPGILEEYDEVATAHDREMTVIRPALLTKFGHLPLLETYKQCTIRHAKAGQLDTALWWANRGVAVYGADAHDESWVNDLRDRADRLQEKVRRRDQPRRGPAVKRATSAGDSTTTETLTCLGCGATFERARTRGRKPHHCPECRSA